MYPDNPRDTMRNLLQALNARYEVSSEPIAAHAYANLARSYAQACRRWADLIDRPASKTGKS